MQNRLHWGNQFVYQRNETHYSFHSCFPYTCRIPSRNEFLKSIDTDSSYKDALSFRHRKSLQRDAQNSHLSTKQGHVTHVCTHITTKQNKKLSARHKALLIICTVARTSSMSTQCTAVHFSENAHSFGQEYFSRINWAVLWEFFSWNPTDYSQSLN